MAGIYSPFLQIYQKFIMIYVCIYYCCFQHYWVILEFILLSLRIEALLILSLFVCGFLPFRRLFFLKLPTLLSYSSVAVSASSK